jgi:hypothetical protein
LRELLEFNLLPGGCGHQLITTALLGPMDGGARRNRTADLLHAIPLFVVLALSIKCLIFNNINKITARVFPACPIDTRKFSCYFVARWLLEIK